MDDLNTQESFDQSPEEFFQDQQLVNFFEMFKDFTDVIEQLPNPYEVFICPLNSISVALH